MLHLPLWKRVTIVSTCVAGVLFALPNFLPKSVVESLPNFMPKEQVVLGLDLQGGAHLLLEVDVNAVIAEHMEMTLDGLRTTLRKSKIGYIKLFAKGDTISFQMRNGDDHEKLNEFFKEMGPGWTHSADGDTVRLTLTTEAARGFKERAVTQSIEIVRRRVDETGTAEPLIVRQGDDRILVQLPGLDDPTRIKDLLGKTAKLQFRMVDVTAANGAIPPGSEILESMDTSRGSPKSYVVEKKVRVTGENLVDAQPGFDEYNRPNVNIKFDSLGGKKFWELTKNNVGKPFAIVLDDKVLSAPVIQVAIPGGSGQITGSFTVQEAQDLALLMRSGALPAPLKIIEERTVGPGLGADSIDAGQTATVIAIVVVAVFMLLAYSWFGLVANVALIFNIVLLLGAMSATGATLTLPGIAGIALTIGMAVDANVLINERIKEELRLGRKIISAVDAGYSRAMETIIDSNLTTLIGGALLYYFGTGPIKGFAVTLSFGIIISMFTAISLTRLIAAWYLKARKPKVLPI